MKNRLAQLCVCLGVWGLMCAPSLRAGEDTRALLDIMVKKGIVTQEEAGDVAAAITKDEEENVSATKLKINSGVQNLTIFGDARVRYEMRDGQSINDPASGQTAGTRTRDRYRYALHLGIKGDLTDKFYYEVRLTTNNNPRSPNVTFNDDTTGNGTGSKASDVVYVDHVFLGWRPTDFLNIVVGRQANPLYTTSMVWDSDIAPEGLTEQLSFDVAKDWTFFTTFGQYVYSDTGDNVSGAGTNHTDTLLLPFQIGTSGKITKDLGFKIAPTFYLYVGHGDPLNGNGRTNFTTGYGTPGVTDSASYANAVNTATDELAVLEIPLEFTFRAWDIPFRPYANFAINTTGDKRAEYAGRSDKKDQDKAYQIGLDIGQSKKKGDWEVNAWWQHVEAFSLDPNLVDADIFDSRINMEGFAISTRYCFTDNVSGALTYANGDRIDNTLGNGASQGDLTDINPLGNYHLLQADICWKF